MYTKRNDNGSTITQDQQCSRTMNSIPTPRRIAASIHRVKYVEPQRPRRSLSGELLLPLRPRVVPKLGGLLLELLDQLPLALPLGLLAEPGGRYLLLLLDVLSLVWIRLQRMTGA